MPPDPPTTLLPLRREGDNLVVSFGADSPFGAATLSFPGGGRLTVDPSAPGRLLSVTTAYPDVARTTLTQLLGAAAMTALIDIHFDGAADLPDTPDGRLVPIEPTDAATALARLALVSWVADWAPLDVPRLALLADVGDAAHRAGNPALAYDSFHECAWFLLELSRAAQAQHTGGPLASALAQVLRSAADVLGATHGQHTQLVAAATDLALAGSVPAVSGPSIDAGADHPRGAAPLGRSGGQPSPKTGMPFPVQWTQVPARVFDAAEDAGTVTHFDSGVRVSVRAARWMDLTQASGLRARLLAADTGETLASAPLVFDQALNQFITEFHYDQWADQVDPAALHEAVPDVYSDVSDAPPPLDPAQRQLAHAHRCAVRALTAHRKARASEATAGPADADAEADAEANAAIQGFASLDPAAAAALQRWQQARRGPTIGPGAPTQSEWLDGLPLPGADQVDRPLLTELVAATDPRMWPGAAPSEPRVNPRGEPNGDRVVLGTSPFGAAVAPLRSTGGLEVDPAAPERILSVSDISGDGVEALARALDGDAARRIVEMGLRQLSGDDVGDVAMASPQMGRLALALWWDAQPLVDAPASATGLDVALAAHQAGREELAASLFQKWADFARALGSSIADRVLPAPLSAEVRTTLLAAAEQVPETAVAEDLMRTADVLATAEVSDADLALLWDAVGDRERRSIAGAPQGVFSVDWDHIRARTVSAEEGAVTASTSASGIEVRAVAHRFRDVAASRDLAVRLVDSGDGIVVASAPLLWSPEADCFVARFESAGPGSIDQPDLSRVVPEVYSAQIPSAMRVGAQADEAQARRTAVRALVLARRNAASFCLFGRVDPDLTSRVRRLVTRAERGFRHAGNDAAADQVVAWHSVWTPDQHTVGAGAPLLSEMLAIAAPDLLDIEQARRT